MYKYLRPSRFEVDANATGADKQWSHWYKTFSNFLDAIAKHEPDKLVTLTNYVAPNVYEYIAECTTYAKHVLATRQLHTFTGPRTQVAGPQDYRSRPKYNFA